MYRPGLSAKPSSPTAGRFSDFEPARSPLLHVRPNCRLSTEGTVKESLLFTSSPSRAICFNSSLLLAYPQAVCDASFSRPLTHVSKIVRLVGFLQSSAPVSKENWDMRMRNPVCIPSEMSISRRMDERIPLNEV